MAHFMLSLLPPCLSVKWLSCKLENPHIRLEIQTSFHAGDNDRKTMRWNELRQAKTC